LVAVEVLKDELQRSRRASNVRELITLGALDDVVKDKDIAVVGGLEDQDILLAQHQI
jgi:hypothetical protein